MAWMNQEKKAAIKAELVKVMPKNWKWSLSVNNHSTIVLTISAAPIDLIAAHMNKYSEKATNLELNEFYLERAYEGELLELFTSIKTALNLNNFDHSEPMSDYFHVGHYVSMNIGKWDKPFLVTT